MIEEKNSHHCTGNAICDAVRFVNAAVYAVLPQDVAHKLAELEKNFWGGVRWLVDKEIGWIDDTKEAADRLREEWQRKREQGSTATGTTTTDATPGGGI